MTPTLITKKQGDAWVQVARGLARGAATVASSWTTDGNHPQQHYHKLLAIEEAGGDLEPYLPARPNLSGEYADGPTPAELVHEVTGYMPYGEDSNSEFDAMADEICNAWEEEVGEVFHCYCMIDVTKAIEVHRRAAIRIQEETGVDMHIRPK